ncbi:unnamed protein product [Auanema sp. JU1783]|nr:unnamed protein product [Auanema sp. JU1783]
MAPTTSISDPDSRIYHTRFRKCIQKKYDDIFSSVVQKALTKSPNLIEETMMSSENHRRKSNSLSCSNENNFIVKKRSISESGNSCELSSLGSESSLDSDSCESISETNSPIEVDNDIIIEYQCKKTPFDVSCCGKNFYKHENLHEHLVLEHSPSPKFSCPKCNVNLKALRNQHLCRICKEFAWKLEPHLTSHYQDRTGQGALMECRHCYRSFPTVREVRDHEKRVHQAKAKILNWNCKYCHQQFDSRHMRDSHLVAHVDQTGSNIWAQIDKMQELMTDQVLVNQCPICLSVMGSRKSFRLHIIHKHLAQDPQSFLSFIGVTTDPIATVFDRKAIKEETVEDIKPVIGEVRIKDEPCD